MAIYGQEYGLQVCWLATGPSPAQGTLRIADRTSTTKTAITMTTDFDRHRADDLFVSNEVLRLPRDERLTGLNLAGALWLIRGQPPAQAHRLALDYVARRAVNHLAGHVLWLLACDSLAQPDSRIVRHRKLWGALKSQGLTVPDGRVLPEHVVGTPDGVRHFGAMQLGLRSFDPAVAVLHAEPASHIVAMRENDEPVVERLSANGWGRPPFGPSPDVISAVCSAEGVVLWPVGAFDDREAGAVAIDPKGIIDSLYG